MSRSECTCIFEDNVYHRAGVEIGNDSMGPALLELTQTVAVLDGLRCFLHGRDAGKFMVNEKFT